MPERYVLEVRFVPYDGLAQVPGGLMGRKSSPAVNLLISPRQFTCTECRSNFASKAPNAMFCPNCRPSVAVERAKRSKDAGKRRKDSRLDSLVR